MPLALGPLDAPTLASCRRTRIWFHQAVSRHSVSRQAWRAYFRGTGENRPGAGAAAPEGPSGLNSSLPVACAVCKRNSRRRPAAIAFSYCMSRRQQGMLLFRPCTCSIWAEPGETLVMISWSFKLAGRVSILVQCLCIVDSLRVPTLPEYLCCYTAPLLLLQPSAGA